MTRNIEHDETPGRIIEHPDPTWFTTQLTDGGHTYPRWYGLGFLFAMVFVAAAIVAYNTRDTW